MKSLFTVFGFAALVVFAQSCPEGQVLCEGTENECIPEEYVCDYEYLDCSNDWDETDCPCRPDREWTCANGDCVQAGDDCDGYQDCRDNSDESECVTCRVFQCEDGKCLNKYQLCDGRDDCVGGEDEEPGCPKCDPRFEWTCEDLSCILKSWVCDGYDDCPDGSDEKNCSLADSLQFASKAREQAILGARKYSKLLSSVNGGNGNSKLNRTRSRKQPSKGSLYSFA